MPKSLLLGFALLLLTGCAPATPALSRAQLLRLSHAKSLAEARHGFQTHLLAHKKTPAPVLPPPPGFQLIHYAAPLGSFPAYLADPPPSPSKRPALVWIAGGFENSIDDTPWAAATPDNDQSARAFRQAGIMTLYPSLRGGNNNPGYREGLYGEVDDVIAAAKYLASRPDVDPKRIYLGGHSTGGTLALLVAESTSGFRAVFAFGPVSSVGLYGPENLPFEYHDRQELLLRAPVLFLQTITTPTYVFEGTEQGNIESLRKMASLCTNPRVQFFELPGLSHFSALAPITPVIAAQVAQDTGPTPQFSFTQSSPQIRPSRK